MRAFIPCLLAGLCTLGTASAAQPKLAVGTASTAPTATRSVPNPAGLQPVYPAGISSGSGAAVSSSGIARANSPIPAGEPAPGTTITGNGGVVLPTEVLPVETGIPSTSVMGAGATVAGPSQYATSGAAGYSATDVARSFFFADANHDGELTPAEFRRLTIAPETFEQMDRNFDGVISRFEYEDATR